jgi:hypothetical protein
MRNNVDKIIFKEIEGWIEEVSYIELRGLERSVDESTLDGDVILDDGRLVIENLEKRRKEHLRSLRKGDFIPEESSSSADFVKFIETAGVGHVDESGTFIGW